MSIRTELDTIQLNRLAENLKAIPFGELLSFLIEKATATEAGVVPSANVATLANTPTAMLQVNVTAGTVTGIKTLRIGVVGTDVPATGEAIWQPGTKLVAFAAADAATAVSFTYVQATDKASCMEADANVV